jgi:hypothetical protein
MQNWLIKTKSHLTDKNFLISLIIGMILLLGSLVINFYAGMYATEKASNSVTDIILSNIRVYDVDGIFIYGAILFWVFTGLLCIFEPKRLPFTLKSIALFVVIRSVFISLTHIGPFPMQMIMTSSKIMQKFSFGADLFFSGHTGLPFLMALIFWQKKPLRWFFIISSIVFGAVVLLGHLHYSIDVLSAFFITYTIFHIAEILFKKDRQVFFNGI